MRLVLISMMVFLVLSFPSCNKQQWKMAITSPQNGVSVTTASINLSGNLYLTSSFAQDNKILSTLKTGQREELRKQIPPLSAFYYCAWDRG